MHRRYVQSPLTCQVARIAAVASSGWCISVCCGDPHSGARTPRGQTKSGSDFKYDILMGFGVPSTIVKGRVRRTYEKKCGGCCI